MGCCWAATFPMTHVTLPYGKAIKILNTGDLVYFCNLGSATSYFTIAATGYAVSHMGMIVVLSDGVIGVLESVRHDDNMCDLLKKMTPEKIHKGVRIVDFKDKLTLHGRLASTPIYIQPLNVADEYRPHMESELKKFIRKVDCAPYEDHILCMCSAPLREMLTDKPAQSCTPTSFYCSELIAEAYKAMGILSPSLNGQFVWPNVFLQNQLTLLHGTSLDSVGFYCNPPGKSRRRVQTTTEPLPPSQHSYSTDLLIIHKISDGKPF